MSGTGGGLGVPPGQLLVLLVSSVISAGCHSAAHTSGHTKKSSTKLVSAMNPAGCHSAVHTARSHPFRQLKTLSFQIDDSSLDQFLIQIFVRPEFFTQMDYYLYMGPNDVSHTKQFV
jgi:hypothetical protein